MDAVTAALVGSTVTGSVSIVAILANMYVSKRSLQHAAAKEIAKLSVELKIQQLNELYGPLLELTEQNFRLAQKIREGKQNPQEWRLLDHLQEVLADPTDGPIASAILEIDGKIEALIINKGGLVQGTRPPDSFKLFLGHYQLLKLAMQGKKIVPKADEYYPRQFDEDVKIAYAKIKGDVDSVLARSEGLLSEFGR